MQAHQLVMRDPAMAAIMGVMGTSHADFGDDIGEFGGDFGDDFGFAGGDEFDGEDDFGDEMEGDDYDFGAARRSRGASRGLMQAKRALNFRRVMHRKHLINPNANSSLKVERYTFSISENITLGTPQTFTTLTGQPDVTIRPQRLTCNAPSPMFAFFQVIRMANVNVTVGTGQEDAFNYNANGVGQILDMPTLNPANRATVLGSYSGFTPPGFIPATVVPFTVTFKGPATLVAQ